jgi:SHS2 domain-containing protein
MSYRWVEHTGEMELEIEAPTEEEVFAQALKAFAELLGDDGHGSHLSREIRVAGPERAVLLVEWLDELVYLAETESLVPQEVERIELPDGGVVASVRFHRGNPRPLVKGATYHRLAFAPTRDGFRARVVLDV